MKDKLRNILNYIPLANELDNNIEMGFEKAKNEESNRRNRWLRLVIGVVAALTIMVTSAGIIGFDKVEAAIKQALQYVPGYNVIVDKAEGEVLALQDKVIFVRDDIFIDIIAASKLDGHFNISIESNYDRDKYFEISLINKRGRVFQSENWSRAYGGDFWKGDYYFKLDEEDKDYTLMIGEYEVPFSLGATRKVEDFLQLGNHASSKGINIVALKKSLEDRLMISLLNMSEDKIVYEYPFEENLWGAGWGFRDNLDKSMYIIDKEGNKTYPNIPSSFGNLMPDFNFNIRDEEELKLVLPYVKIIYNDLKSDKLKIAKPKEGETIDINKSLSLGEFNIEVRDIRHEGEELIISLDSQSPVDEKLEEVKIGGINGYGIWFNEESGYVELFINQEDVGKKFSIYFESPRSLLLGDWKIDLD